MNAIIFDLSKPKKIVNAEKFSRVPSEIRQSTQANDEPTLPKKPILTNFPKLSCFQGVNFYSSSDIWMWSWISSKFPQFLVRSRQNCSIFLHAGSFIIEHFGNECTVNKQKRVVTKHLEAIEENLFWIDWKSEQMLILQRLRGTQTLLFCSFFNSQVWTNYHTDMLKTPHMFDEHLSKLYSVIHVNWHLILS